MKIAKAQKDLHRLALQMLEDDKFDGARWTAWMDKHDSLLREMIDDARMHSEMSEDEENVITETAG